MKFNKKLLSIFLVLMMLFAATACSTPAEEPAATMEVTEEAPATADAADTSAAEASTLELAVNAYFENLPEHIYKIGQHDFVQMVKDGTDMYILDIRSAEDYAKGHVQGAFNAPWGTAISDNLKNIPTDKPLFVYCYSGQTAGQAVHTLNVAGFDARSVNLGWNFGISKVDGVDEITSTEAVAFGEAVTEIDPAIQIALDAYYAGLADVSSTTFKNYKVSEADLKAMIDANDDFYLLSIRSQEDFDKGHITGANLLPYAKGMNTGFATLPKDKKIVVYCYSGQTAGQTTAALRLLGYDAVSLNGGMGVGANAPLGWVNQGFMVESPITTAVNAYFENLPDHIYKIAQNDFVQMVKDGEDMYVIDIRSAKDYAAGHIQGAVNMPWGPAISDNLMNIPTDKPVFIYCYSGQTAGQAVHTLNVAGFDARSVNLGWNFGISKVDGVADVTTTETTEIVALGNDVDPSIQVALDAYYAGLSDVNGTTYANYKISEADLKALIDAGDESIYILSIRSEKDYKDGHIEGANLLPYEKGMNAGFGNLPTDKTIVVYCYSGQTAGQTTAALRLLGFDAVSLNGGLGVGANAPLGWTNQGFPVVQ
ncbi:MAG: rhodanese-like domain-containing protein [Clostridia bacterium]|nr:rhodanese-like domain-containing protein [Clostridia bacterium]